MAKVTINFDAWKEGKVASTQHEVSIILPKTLDFKLEPVSSRLIKEFIHPNKASFITGLHFDQDGKRIIAGDTPGGVIAVWNVESGKRLTTIDTGIKQRGSNYYHLIPDWKMLYLSSPGKMNFERVDKDGKSMCRWEFNGSIRSWELPSGKPTKNFQHDPPRYIRFMRLSPDGGKLLTAEEVPGIYDDNPPGAFSLWDTKSGKYVQLQAAGHTYSHFSPDGKTLAGAAIDKNYYSTTIMLVDTESGKVSQSMVVKEKNATVNVSQFSSDSKRMLVSYQVHEKPNDWKNFNSRYEVMEMASMKKVATLSAEPNESLVAYFSPNNHSLVALNWRKEVPRLLVFSISENRVMKTVEFPRAAKGERLMTSQPVFSPDGNELAIITQIRPESRDPNLDALDLPQPRIHLIDVAAGEIRETLVAPQCFSRDLCFSPDGRTLAVGGHGRVLLFDVTQRAQ